MRCCSLLDTQGKALCSDAVDLFYKLLDVQVAIKVLSASTLHLEQKCGSEVNRKNFHTSRRMLKDIRKQLEHIHLSVWSSKELYKKPVCTCGAYKYITKQPTN